MNKKTLSIHFVIFLILCVCWVFLRIGTDMHNQRKNDEASEERASERAKQISELEKDLEKQREAFRKKWGEEPSF